MTQTAYGLLSPPLKITTPVAFYQETKGPDFDILLQLRGPKSAPVYLWRHGVQIEDAALTQLLNLAKVPFVYKHVAAMPDTHYGIGATVGSVFASLGAVIPAAVGVDIGCGMIAARTNLIKSDFWAAVSPAFVTGVRTEIERRVPMGRTNRGGPGDRGAWHKIPPHIEDAWNNYLALEYGLIGQNNPGALAHNNVNHLGTLGTGNHFIEIQYDEEDRIWIMLHSGSRGPGNRIGTFFIQLAKQLMEQYYISLPDKDLAYFPERTQGYTDYLRALAWAQKFAYVNREIMLQATHEALKSVFSTTVTLEETINTHHNYAQLETHFGRSVLLTRKGAISAGDGEPGIIPGSMGTRSYIVRGRGNPLSFHSCSHGAGRAMSRTEAKRRFTVDDHIRATTGVECRKDADVIDETPMAYKDIDAVIEAEKDLVEVVHTMKQLICCKG